MCGCTIHIVSVFAVGLWCIWSVYAWYIVLRIVCIVYMPVELTKSIYVVSIYGEYVMVEYGIMGLDFRISSLIIFV